MRALLALALLGLAVPASAQERIVHLDPGQSISAVLESEGCTDDQIAKIWKLVAFESGLEPIDELYIPVGHPIVIKRDCEGRLLQEREADSTTRLLEDEDGDEKENGDGEDDNPTPLPPPPPSPPTRSSLWVILSFVFAAIALVAIAGVVILWRR